MGSVRHPEVTLGEVLRRVPFPLYLSLLPCSSFSYRAASELLEICPRFSSALQRHCQHNTQATRLRSEYSCFRTIRRHSLKEQGGKGFKDVGLRFLDAFQPVIVNSLGEEGQRLSSREMP